jgi:hypothetical protein
MAISKRAKSPLLIAVLLAIAALGGIKTVLAQPTENETAVCGSLREPFTFWMWRRVAGAPHPERVAGMKNVERIQFKTRDARVLGGYKIAATNPKGYLLVAQGNAMLADQLVSDLQVFRNQGLDVYVYDYRGYGTSQGKSRLAAIVGDYAALASNLNTLRYSKRLLYGISMGGVILLNAVGESQVYTRLVVDSSPGRISPLGCPERYDPIAHLPENSSRIMIISGTQDTIVPPSQMEELIRVARARGATVLQDNEFAHPYQDSLEATHRRRQKEVAAFLLQD